MSSVHTKPRLLVVDDDEDIRALLRLLLERAGDDVAKPFDRDELLARVENLLRRAPRDDEPVSYTDSFMQVDFVQRTLSIEGRDVPLTRTQYNLLEAFARHPNQV